MLPWLPWSVPGTKVAGLSTSLMASVPDVVSTASVSVKLALAPLITAALLAPLILTVMVPVVPSALVTAKTSL